MNRFLSTRIILCFLYKIIIHPHEATDSSLSSGACFHKYIWKSRNEKVVCHNISFEAQTLQKRYELIPLSHKTALYFWLNIIINPHEDTDSSVSSGACFHDYIWKSRNEKVVCDNISFEAQTLQKRYELTPLNYKTDLYFLYKIIIHPHEETDLSMSSGACFHDLVIKSGIEKLFWDNISFEAQTD